MVSDCDYCDHFRIDILHFTYGLAVSHACLIYFVLDNVMPCTECLFGPALPLNIVERSDREVALCARAREVRREPGTIEILLKQFLGCVEACGQKKSKTLPRIENEFDVLIMQIRTTFTCV